MKNTIILYGMRGAGKSIVGLRLAKELEYDFLDLDKFIEEKNNKILGDFILEKGWNSFRKEENICLKEVLEKKFGKKSKGKIISLGGGTIVFKNNREELSKHKNIIIIYLNTKIENIAARILKDEKTGRKRSSLTGKSVSEELKSVFSERKEIYENNFDFEVDNNGEVNDTIGNIKKVIKYGSICVPVNSVEKIFNFFDEIKLDRKIKFIELRLDLMFEKIDFGLLEKIIKDCPKQIICTNRIEKEGGKFNGSSEENVYILNRCVELGTDYIDIELKSLREENIEKFVLDIKSKLIISYHDFKKTPALKTLQNILKRMGKFFPDIYKIAVMPNNDEDVQNIYSLNKYFNNEIKSDELEPEKNIFISMGQLGIQTRIDLVKEGNLLTFGAYGNDISAPGQINYKILYQRIFKNNEVLFLGGPQILGSFSPFMHNYSSKKLESETYKFNYKLFVQEKYDENNAEKFVKILNSNEKFLGANITMPYKIDIYNYLGEQGKIDKNAKLVGAVNTLYKKDGVIFGTNTDIEGVIGPIEKKLRGGVKKIKNVYILGAGGAARAAIGAVIKLGVQNIYILNRSQKSLDDVRVFFQFHLNENQKMFTIIYNLLDGNIFPKVGKNSIIINTLPFGFKKDLPKMPITPKDLDKSIDKIKLYFDAVYDSNEGDTPLVKYIISKDKNIKICRGIEMLVGQAKTGFELWTKGGEFMTKEIIKELKKKKKK